MTHYLPLTPYVDMPVQKQIRESALYTKQFMEVPYVKACLPTCGDLGIPVYDENASSNYSNSSYGSNNNGNIIIGYSSVTSYGDTSSMSMDYDEVVGMGQDCLRYGRIIQSPGLQIDGLRYEAQERKLDPYSPLCMVPLPHHLIEPSFIRRRNERERERVRCVNEGYDRLKEHLPLENKDRRISKVEVLRLAIDYIRALQQVVKQNDGERRDQLSRGSDSPCLITESRKRRHSETSDDPASPESDLCSA